MINDYLTVGDVAKLIGVGENAIYKLANEGWLPAYKLQGEWRFRRVDVEQWITDRDKQVS